MIRLTEEVVELIDHPRLSPGSKITFLKLAVRFGDRFRFSDALAVVGNKASTSRHLSELEAECWVGRVPLGYVMLKEVSHGD